MFDLFMSRARLNALEDAYNTLNKIKKSKDVKVVNKGDFHELKTHERTKREIKQGNEDKFMTMIRKQKTKKKMDKYHLTAVIKRSIQYYDKKTGQIKKTYKEEDHVRKLIGHDMLTDSRMIEASSLEEAQQIMKETIKKDQTYEEYSGAALVNIDDVQFIDDEPIVESNIKSSDIKHMPLRQVGHIEYNFTEQETKYLTKDNTCVIDNLVGLYGTELKLNKDKIIKLNKEFHGFVDEVEDNEPEYIESELGDMIINFKYNNKKPVYNIDNAFTPNFIDYFCRKFGISHYAYDINKTCFMKYVHKNQNHRALCYYAMNNHMYLVKK